MGQLQIVPDEGVLENEKIEESIQKCLVVSRTRPFEKRFKIALVALRRPIVLLLLLRLTLRVESVHTLLSLLVVIVLLGAASEIVIVSAFSIS